MAHSSGILKMFEVIELALEAAPPGSFRQMMGFIDNDSEGLALKQCRFHGFAWFPGTYPRDLAIAERIMEGTQDRPLILRPLEAVAARSCGEDTGKRDEAGIRRHQCAAFGQQSFFE